MTVLLPFFGAIIVLATQCNDAAGSLASNSSCVRKCASRCRVDLDALQLRRQDPGRAGRLVHACICVAAPCPRASAS
jgi:hypothetical protein